MRKCERCEVAQGFIECLECGMSEGVPMLLCEECSKMIHVGAKLTKHTRVSKAMSAQREAIQNKLDACNMCIASLREKRDDLELAKDNLQEIMRIHDRNVKECIVELQQLLKDRAKDILQDLTTDCKQREQKLQDSQVVLDTREQTLVQHSKTLEQMLSKEDSELADDHDKLDINTEDLPSIDMPDLSLNYALCVDGLKSAIQALVMQPIKSETPVVLEELELPSLSCSQGGEITGQVASTLSQKGVFWLTPLPDENRLIVLQKISIRIRAKFLADSQWKTYATMQESPEPGQLVYAQCEHDAKWLRGRIEDSKTDKNTRLVRFYDYGNVQEVPLKRILPCKVDVAPKVTPQALECCLFPKLDVRVLMDSKWAFNDLVSDTLVNCTLQSQVRSGDDDVKLWYVKVHVELVGGEMCCVNDAVQEKMEEESSVKKPTIACRDIRVTNPELFSNDATVASPPRQKRTATAAGLPGMATGPAASVPPPNTQSQSVPQVPSESGTPELAMDVEVLQILSPPQFPPFPGSGTSQCQLPVTTETQQPIASELPVASESQPSTKDGAPPPRVTSPLQFPPFPEPSTAKTKPGGEPIDDGVNSTASKEQNPCDSISGDCSSERGCSESASHSIRAAMDANSGGLSCITSVLNPAATEFHSKLGVTPLVTQSLEGATIADLPAGLPTIVGGTAEKYLQSDHTYVCQPDAEQMSRSILDGVLSQASRQYQTELDLAPEAGNQLHCQQPTAPQETAADLDALECSTRFLAGEPMPNVDMTSSGGNCAAVQESVQAKAFSQGPEEHLRRETCQAETGNGVLQLQVQVEGSSARSCGGIAPEMDGPVGGAFLEQAELPRAEHMEVTDGPRQAEIVRVLETGQCVIEVTTSEHNEVKQAPLPEQDEVIDVQGPVQACIAEPGEVIEIHTHERDEITEVPAAEPDEVIVVPMTEPGKVTEVPTAEPDEVTVAVPTAERGQFTEVPTAEPDEVTVAVPTAERGQFTEVPTAEPDEVTVAVPTAEKGDVTEVRTAEPDEVTVAVPTAERGQFTEVPTAEPDEVTVAVPTTERGQFTEVPTAEPDEVTVAVPTAERGLFTEVPTAEPDGPVTVVVPTAERGQFTEVPTAEPDEPVTVAVPTAERGQITEVPTAEPDEPVTVAVPTPEIGQFTEVPTAEPDEVTAVEPTPERGQITEVPTAELDEVTVAVPTAERGQFTEVPTAEQQDIPMVTQVPEVAHYEVIETLTAEPDEVPGVEMNKDVESELTRNEQQEVNRVPRAGDVAVTMVTEVPASKAEQNEALDVPARRVQVPENGQGYITEVPQTEQPIAGQVEIPQGFTDEEREIRKDATEVPRLAQEITEVSREGKHDLPRIEQDEGTAVTVSGQQVVPEAQEVPKTGQDEVPKAGQDEVPKAGHDEVPKAGQDGVPKAGQDEVPKAGHDEVPKAGQDEVPKAGQDKVPKAGQDKVPKAGQDVPKAGHDEVVPKERQDEVPKAGQDMVPKARQDGVTEVAKTDLDEVITSKVARAGVTDPPDIAQRGRPLLGSSQMSAEPHQHQTVPHHVSEINGSLEAPVAVAAAENGTMDRASEPHDQRLDHPMTTFTEELWQEGCAAWQKEVVTAPGVQTMPQPVDGTRPSRKDDSSGDRVRKKSKETKKQEVSPKPPPKRLEDQLPQAQRFVGGRNYAKVATGLGSNGQFWVVLARDNDAEQAHQFLHNSLVDHAKIATSVASSEIHHRMMVLVPRSKDMRIWYRGVVEDIQDKNNVLIRLVDYGIPVIIPTSCLKNLPETFHHLPIQAMHCSLQSAEYPFFTEQAQQLFRKLTSDKTLLVKVVQLSSNNMCHVQLFDANVGEGVAPVNIYQRIYEQVPMPGIHNIAPFYSPNLPPPNMLSQMPVILGAQGDGNNPPVFVRPILPASSHPPTTQSDQWRADYPMRSSHWGGVWPGTEMTRPHSRDSPGATGSDGSSESGGQQWQQEAPPAGGEDLWVETSDHSSSKETSQPDDRQWQGRGPSHQRRNPPTSRDRRTNNTRCFNCDGIGHYQGECPQPHRSKHSGSRKLGRGGRRYPTQGQGGTPAQREPDW